MAELADALDLGSSVARRECSSHFIRTRTSVYRNVGTCFFIYNSNINIQDSIGGISMSTFYVETLEDIVVITGDDAEHILKSQRKTIGDVVTLSDGKGLVASAKIIDANKGSVTLSTFDTKNDDREPRVKITLLQAMPKGDKPELIIQKATELGVYEIVFFLSEFCVSRPDDKSFKKKLERYQKIALEAAKQCGRGQVPKILGLLSFKEAVKLTEHTVTAVLYEKSTLPFRDILSTVEGSLCLVVGSEGGFSEKEIDTFITSGSNTATLGKRILRCETALLAAIYASMFFFEEF